MVIIQLAVLLICIFIGARMSGIGSRRYGHDRTAYPAVCFRHATCRSSSGSNADYIKCGDGSRSTYRLPEVWIGLVKIAGKILRSHPGQITLLGPLVTYLFTLFAGTAHISYCILPIIAEVAIKARIRPERALSMSVTAAHMGITASPVSAASAALLTVLVSSGVKLSDILIVCIPSTLIGVLVGILFVYKRGKELSEDKEFLEKMKDPAFAANIDSDCQETMMLH